MRNSTLLRSSAARSGRRSRLVSVPVTGAAALALVLTGCGADEEEGVDATDVVEEDEGLVEEDTEMMEEDTEAMESDAAGDTAAAAVPGSFVVGDVAVPQLLTEADPQAALAELPDDPAVATEVPVLAVPTDEGFWIGTEAARIWVQLTAPGESPMNVNPGDRVSFTGEIVPNADGFVEGLSLPADQAAALTDLGYHVDVPAGEITIA
ncbi:hypothetical protein O2V63_12870 [Modestobacter sp. VKM Ac-2977]|uniref:hypothetical protein n=1 Tax=Modestobacter sp. VKM Ac-2977 TaxID=3004131 RepID=UPI0022AA2B40|nr:hypothetical protein [Modestobacter sp. VKM Ac-2977]MCZ2821229.1 hypothetical protein [Modestobacter sp. VKM Ac-2977]